MFDQHHLPSESYIVANMFLCYTHFWSPDPLSLFSSTWYYQVPIHCEDLSIIHFMPGMWPIQVNIYCRSLSLMIVSYCLVSLSSWSWSFYIALACPTGSMQCPSKSYAIFQHYDVICSMEVLEHIDNPASFLSTSATLSQGRPSIQIASNPSNCVLYFIHILLTVHLFLLCHSPMFKLLWNTSYCSFPHPSLQMRALYYCTS